MLFKKEFERLEALLRKGNRTVPKYTKADREVISATLRCLTTLNTSNKPRLPP